MSTKKALSNTNNALRSTGPRSLEGKARSSKNSRIHGILSQSPVIAGVEKEKDWKAHRESIFSDFKPMGAVEVLLVNRIALISWRLARVSRFESSSITGEVKDLIADMEENCQLIKEWQEHKEFLANLINLPKDGLVSSDDALEVVQTVADGIDEPLEEAEEEFFEKFSDDKPISVKDLLKFIAAYAECSVERALQKAMEYADSERFDCKDKIAKGQAELKILGRMPEPETLDKIMRYETHLERSLFRNLHGLERLQAERKGNPVIPPMAVDVDFSVSDDGGNLGSFGKN